MEWKGAGTGNEERLARAVARLKEVAESSETSRNARNTINKSLAMLRDPKVGIAIRAANAVSMLDELAQDPNILSPARVAIWSAISELEGIRE